MATTNEVLSKIQFLNKNLGGQNPPIFIERIAADLKITEEEVKQHCKELASQGYINIKGLGVFVEVVR